MRNQIQHVCENIRALAVAQVASVSNFEIELRLGLIAGQRQFLVVAAGSYAPAGHSPRKDREFSAIH